MLVESAGSLNRARFVPGSQTLICGRRRPARISDGATRRQQGNGPLMKPHHRVVQGYQERLAAAVSRSPLLKATISKNSRLLDCSRLQVVSDNLPRVVLDAVLG